MLWDKEIGRLSWDGRKGISYFEFNPAVIGGEPDPFPLLCEIQGKERKFVISKNKAAYAEIEETGTSNLSIEQLHTLVETYLAR